MIFIIIKNMLFAAAVTINKKALGYTTPLFLIGVRMTIGGSCLLLYSYFNKNISTSIKKHHRHIFAQVVLFSLLLTYMPRTWGLQYLPAYKTFFLNNIAPFCAALYAYFLFNEKLSQKKWLGLFIGVAGMIPILMTTSFSEQKLGEVFFLSWPEIAVMVATCSQVFGKTLKRRLVFFENYAPTFITGISMTVGGFISLIAAFCVDGFFPVREPKTFFSLVALMIVVSNFGAHTMLVWLMRRYTVTFLSLAAFLGPLFTALYSWLLFGEHITWHFFASSAIVFIGLMIFYSEELRTRPIRIDSPTIDDTSQPIKH